MSKAFNDLLREELKKRRLSKRSLSIGAELSEGTVTAVLVDDEHTPAPETVRKLAKFLGKDEDYLLELAGHRTKHPEPYGLIPEWETALKRLAELPPSQQQDIYDGFMVLMGVIVKRAQE